MVTKQQDSRQGYQVGSISLAKYSEKTNTFRLNGLRKYWTVLLLSVFSLKVLNNEQKSLGTEKIPEGTNSQMLIDVISTIINTDKPESKTMDCIFF